MSEIIKGFKAANVFLTNEKKLVKANVFVEDGKITYIGDKEKEGLIELDDNQILVPGFIDEHIHGSFNCDAMDATYLTYHNISKTIAEEGVSSFCITTMTQDRKDIEKAVVAVKEYIELNEYAGAKALGIHLEGPFISVKHKGAQLESAIVKPDVDVFKHYNSLSGNNIRIVTLAYEEDGKELVHYLKDNKIVASIGHTDATCDQTLEGIKEGISCSTHTYNAMKGLHHREAGTVGAVLLSDDVYNELICDLIHISPNAIKLLFKCKGEDKIILITDSMQAKHVDDGEYMFGGQKVYVKNGAARLIDGTLAGSTLWMNKALKNMQLVLGLPLTHIINFATKNPAMNLGIYDKKGSIELGKDADFAVIDKDFNVYMTVSEGHLVYKK